MLCFNKYKSNLKTLSENIWRHKMSSIIFWSSLTRQGYTCRRCCSRSHNCASVSFLWVFLQKISPFPKRMNPNLVITLSAVLRGPPKWIPKGIKRAFYAQNPAATPISEWHTYIDVKLWWAPSLESGFRCCRNRVAVIIHWSGTLQILQQLSRPF